MIAWGVKKAGRASIAASDGEQVWIVDARAVPSLVRTPARLGSQEARVARAVPGRCPLCDADVRHLLLEPPHERIAVAECRDCGFVWYGRHASDGRASDGERS